MLKKINRYDVAFFGGLILVLIVHLSMISMGYVDADESFYLTVPYRFLQGDAPLVDEWHVSQLVGIVLYPFLKLYMLFHHSTDGIYLAFRYMYVGILIISSFVSYCLLRHKNQFLAATASIIFGLFTHGCLRTLSYNTIGLIFVWLLSTVLLSELKFCKKYILAGVILAGVILCNPYMILLYIIYLVACVIRRKENGLFGIKALGVVTIGAGIIFVLFLLFLFSRTTISDLLRNIPFIFNDPAHEVKTLWDIIEPVINFVWWFKPYFIVVICGLIAGMCIPAWRKYVFIGVALISMLLWMLLVVYKTPGIGKHAIMLPMTIIGGIAFVYTRDKSWNVFICGWILGIIYALCMNLSSNQGIYVICNACTVSSCASLFLINDFMGECAGWNRKYIWFFLLIASQILAEVYVNFNYVYWENDISSLKYEIQIGPMRGIYTTKEKKEQYEEKIENIKLLGNLEEKNILFFNTFPAGYMIAENARNGSFSAWMRESPSIDDAKMQMYYNCHEQKIPDIVYITEDTTCEWSDERWNEWGQKHEYKYIKFSNGDSVLVKE